MALEKEDGQAIPHYAMATVVLSEGYQETAMTLCMSIRSGFPADTLPVNLDVIAYIPEDAHERGIAVEWLECCFSHVQVLPHVTVSRPPATEQFKELYIKLRLWQQTHYKRLLYFDADFVVVQVQPLLDVLMHTRFHFGAVQDWYDGRWATHWNGGLLLLEPSFDTYHQLMTSLEPFIEQQRYNTGMAEQGYLSAYYDHLGYTLPTTFNLNVAIKYESPELWQKFADKAVGIHFTWGKPWQQDPEDRNTFPSSVWWAHRERVQDTCPKSS